MEDLDRTKSPARRQWLSPPWIFTLFISVLTLGFWPFSSPSISNYAGLFFVFMSLSVASMTGLWCAISKPWWRYIVAIFVTIINGVALMTGAGNEDELFVFLIPGLISLPIVLPLEGIKSFLGRFVLSAEPNDGFKEGLQFGIGHLMILTAVAAALCAIGRAFFSWFDFQIRTQTIVFVIIIVSVIALNTLISVWAILGNRVNWRLLVSVTTAGLAIFVGGQFSPNGLPGTWIVMFSVVWLVTSILLALLRWDGYRFVSKKPAITTS